ncbi:family 8 glycosyltransferase [Cryphonectria parasitica EP155]|uniref:glycogenin glucosyltransferase n=1 Tax=Cryphonectria parasitica (strain ATCC 38755 / EP155) TaxID=660469 RepID=A0A9P4YBU1_CRYP1|nr:family 8 glycosyltransferase [Cryphonectria parasitica EP155]KAF3770694.1 family 8 glycosyltransferase [Cryphonectria parasitica EP155]
MAAQSGEDAYVTLLLSDTYLPGALVLAHSLRDAGTTKKLAVMVTLDTVSAEVVEQLKKEFDYVLPVPRIRNAKPANLYLMNRADLHSAFTKVNLWKQTMFRKIVYFDADIVAYRAVDELFDLPQPFSAAPDVGWPDIFNTGVMVLTPNLGDYYALTAMTERGISFDGADQGLLNMHFKNSYNRLSFSYNVTPSAHYSYVPAYRHFQSSINLVHFIGSEKPWTQGRSASTAVDSPYGEMLGRWWAVYDRHYRQPGYKVPAIIQYFVKGEFQPPTTTYIVPTGEPPLPQGKPVNGGLHQDQSQQHHIPPSATSSIQEPHRGRPLRQYSWDAQRQPPPADSKPEAINFPQTHYTMSSDPAPWIPPQRYPSPPKNMGYEIPKEKRGSAEKPKPIFPWESQQLKPTRVFANEPTPSEPEPSITEGSTAATSEASELERKSEPTTPTTPTIHVTSSDPWASFTRVNAWDDDPAIEKYIEKLPLYRRHKTQDSQSSVVGQKSPGSLTDFPTAVERPSLPVTPAPVRRPKFWGAGAPGADEDDGGDQLPAATGVPSQSEWDPVARLQLLAKQQSELLLKKLGTGEATAEGNETGRLVGMQGHDIPKRSLPFGSDSIVSPTYIAQSAPVHSPQPTKPPGLGSPRILTENQEEKETTPQATSADHPAEPSYHGPGAMWEKGENYPGHSTVLPPSEEDRDVLET